MSRKFQCKAIPSTWLENNGRRLDCGPYMSGAVEAKELLKKHRTEPLRDLTAGHNGGIFNGPRFPRTYVDDITNGVPFLGSTDILDADLSYVSLLSKKQVGGNPALVLDEGWTLITCSGTIGRMAYARSDMKGMAGSQHFMRVVPEVEEIHPGYLYAYLSSRFGVPIVMSGTYGAIIQHIEPHHIADLPVPRLGEVEHKAHDLIRQAAIAHVESIELRKKAGALVNEICGFPKKLAPAARMFAYSSANSSSVLRRLDATYHNPIAQKAEELAKAANGIALSAAGVFGFESNRMKQVFVEEGYGTPFITSGGIFSKTIMPERYLRNQLLGKDESWRINEYDTLIARSGQVGGIIGRGVWADTRLDGLAASPHILRLRPTSEEFPPGYVYAFLCLTDVGYQLLARTAAGSSIPFLPLDAVLEIKIPTTPSLQQRQQIDALVKRAGELRKQSQELEMEAVALVERTIEEGDR
ncbi:methylation-associated defense system restriction endonuclease subunit S MAD5 [Pseudoxanthomonas spadix]|jgi:type I restriction enzyme S subunit|uniref:methylation-associated defense system restriction endonuclease subunit S MAD5 n=1 Tax=Pseudoxanthomonas spadix TaxID=415229 RepID=UPI000EFDD2C4|nr:restriction endonuclease subunit S [Pseudoxanthomonas spadix]MBP3974394.1 restriction endonuclease subunit S [Pseudoxanthomonas spadix]RMW97418.1 restriction endonuclease subunit S [Pseudoxanthomonas spadix]